jgi:hypothetical protein
MRQQRATHMRPFFTGRSGQENAMKLSKFLLISSTIAGVVVLGRSLLINNRYPKIKYIDDLSFDEASIRELAHQIWESEGKPEGQAARHWAMSIELLRSSVADADYTNTRHRNDNSESSARDTHTHTDKKSLH